MHRTPAPPADAYVDMAGFVGHWLLILGLATLTIWLLSLALSLIGWALWSLAWVIRRLMRDGVAARPRAQTQKRG